MYFMQNPRFIFAINYVSIFVFIIDSYVNMHNNATMDTI